MRVTWTTGRSTWAGLRHGPSYPALTKHGSIYFFPHLINVWFMVNVTHRGNSRHTSAWDSAHRGSGRSWSSPLTFLILLESSLDSDCFCFSHDCVLLCTVSINLEAEIWKRKELFQFQAPDYTWWTTFVWFLSKVDMRLCNIRPPPSLLAQLIKSLWQPVGRTLKVNKKKRRVLPTWWMKDWVRQEKLSRIFEDFPVGWLLMSSFQGSEKNRLSRRKKPPKRK